MPAGQAGQQESATGSRNGAEPITETQRPVGGPKARVSRGRVHADSSEASNLLVPTPLSLQRCLTSSPARVPPPCFKHKGSGSRGQSSTGTSSATLVLRRAQGATEALFLSVTALPCAVMTLGSLERHCICWPDPRILTSCTHGSGGRPIGGIAETRWAWREPRRDFAGSSRTGRVPSRTPGRPTRRRRQRARNRWGQDGQPGTNRGLPHVNAWVLHPAGSAGRTRHEQRKTLLPERSGYGTAPFEIIHWRSDRNRSLA